MRISFEIKPTKRRKAGDKPSVMSVHEAGEDTRIVLVVPEDDAPTPNPAPAPKRTRKLPKK